MTYACSLCFESINDDFEYTRCCFKIVHLKCRIDNELECRICGNEQYLCCLKKSIIINFFRDKCGVHPYRTFMILRRIHWLSICILLIPIFILSLLAIINIECNCVNDWFSKNTNILILSIFGLSVSSFIILSCYCFVCELVEC